MFKFIWSRAVYNGTLVYTPDKLAALTQALDNWNNGIVSREKKSDEVKEAAQILIGPIPTGGVRATDYGYFHRVSSLFVGLFDNALLDALAWYYSKPIL